MLVLDAVQQLHDALVDGVLQVQVVQLVVRTPSYNLKIVRHVPLKHIRKKLRCSYRTVSCISRTFLPQNQVSKEGVRLIHEYIQVLRYKGRNDSLVE